jgi:hypothetical protein
MIEKSREEKSAAVAMDAAMAELKRQAKEVYFVELSEVNLPDDEAILFQTYKISDDFPKQTQLCRLVRREQQQRQQQQPNDQLRYCSRICFLNTKIVCLRVPLVFCSPCCSTKHKL